MPAQNPVGVLVQYHRIGVQASLALDEGMAGVDGRDRITVDVIAPQVGPAQHNARADVRDRSHLEGDAILKRPQQSLGDVLSRVLAEPNRGIRIGEVFLGELAGQRAVLDRVAVTRYPPLDTVRAGLARPQIAGHKQPRVRIKNVVLIRLAFDSHGRKEPRCHEVLGRLERADSHLRQRRVGVNVPSRDGGLVSLPCAAHRMVTPSVRLRPPSGRASSGER